MGADDPRTVISRVVMGVEPGMDPLVVAQVVADTLRLRPAQRQVAQLLQTDPGLLTSGRPEGPRSIERLIRALIGRGAVAVTLPRCAWCGHARPLETVDPQGRRICNRCTTRKRAEAEVCANCRNHRAIAHRDRLGKPRCAYCPPHEDEPLDLIAGVLHGLGLEVHTDSLTRAVTACTTQPAQRRRLAWALEDRPTLLTGEAAEGPAVVVKFIEALIAEGVAAVMPPCSNCHRNRRLTNQLNGRRCCVGCYTKARYGTGQCSRCRKVKQLIAKAPDGQLLCHRCRWKDPLDHEPCGTCGATRGVQARANGIPECERCCARRLSATRPPKGERDGQRQNMLPEPCSGCGRTVRPRGRSAAGEPLCETCARRPEPCTSCGNARIVQGRTTGGQPLCRYCYRKHPDSWRPCSACGAVRQIHHHGLCEGCALAEQVRTLLAAPEGGTRPEVAPILQSLCSQPAARMLAWVQRPSTKAVLAALANGTGPIDHRTLDQLPAHTHTIDHLRGILVTTGVLPARDEYLAALDRWVSKTLIQITDPHERALATQYVNWQHLRRLRSKARRSAVTYAENHGVRTEVRAIVRLLAWLRDNGRSLADCQQSDLDTWLAEGPIRRYAARGFILWAVARHQAHKVTIDATSRDAVPPFIADDDRRQLVVRLLQEPKIADVDRVAGLLVLLFAQPCSRIVRLTADHVDRSGPETTLALGRKPVSLPPPVDELVRRLVERTSDRPAGVTHWLFPGGIPGRHRSAEALVGRLNALDIQVRPARNTTMRDLAGDVPAAVLSHLLGLHVRTTTDWVQQARAGGADYAAEVARRGEFRKE